MEKYSIPIARAYTEFRDAGFPTDRFQTTIPCLSLYAKSLDDAKIMIIETGQYLMRYDQRLKSIHEPECKSKELVLEGLLWEYKNRLYELEARIRERGLSENVYSGGPL